MHGLSARWCSQDLNVARESLGTDFLCSKAILFILQIATLNPTFNTREISMSNYFANFSAVPPLGLTFLITLSRIVRTESLASLFWNMLNHKWVCIHFNCEINTRKLQLRRQEELPLQYRIRKFKQGNFFHNYKLAIEISDRNMHIFA